MSSQHFRETHGQMAQLGELKSSCRNLKYRASEFRNPDYHLERVPENAVTLREFSERRRWEGEAAVSQTITPRFITARIQRMFQLYLPTAKSHEILPWTEEFSLYAELVKVAIKKVPGLYKPFGSDVFLSNQQKVRAARAIEVRLEYLQKKLHLLGNSNGQSHGRFSKIDRLVFSLRNKLSGIETPVDVEKIWSAIRAVSSAINGAKSSLSRQKIVTGRTVISSDPGPVNRTEAQLTRAINQASAKLNVLISRSNDGEFRRWRDELADIRDNQLPLSCSMSELSVISAKVQEYDSDASYYLDKTKYAKPRSVPKFPVLDKDDLDLLTHGEILRLTSIDGRLTHPKYWVEKHPKSKA